MNSDLFTQKLENCQGERQNSEIHLDSYNEKLYNDLNCKFKNGIELYKNKCGDYWSFYYPSIILAGSTEPNPEAFTHELLHIYLTIYNFSKTILKDYLSLLSLDKNSKLVNYLQDSIFSFIENSIAHFKMLPIFVNLGYDKNKFFNNTNQCVFNADLNTLSEDFKNNKIENWFPNYIIFYFNFRYHLSANLKTAYEALNEKLKLLNEPLFQILNAVCDIWEKDMDNYNNAPFWQAFVLKLDDYLKQL